jgi:hypothetical protein
MASLIYNSFAEDFVAGDIAPPTDTFKMMLVTSSYTENKDSHEKRSDITNEVSGTGYTAEGEVVAVTSIVRDNATDRVTINFGAVTWPASTITARKAVIYKSRGGLASADELVCVNDFGSDIVSTGGNFTVPAGSVYFQN